MTEGGKTDYNLALPLLLQKLYPPGLLGLGLTALLASFMSGMAGNVTAFNTVWTYDIYQTLHPAGRGRRALPVDGRGWRRSSGRIASIGTAYIAMMFNNIMDLLQLVFSFINAPLFATFLLGMFWKRTSANGAFWGLLGGTGAAAVHYALTGVEGGRVGRAARLLERHGAELLGRDRRLDQLLRPHDRHQPRHEATRREGPRRPRLLADADGRATRGWPGTAGRPCSAPWCWPCRSR